MQIDELLKLMVNKAASDLHLTVTSPPVFRIDGELIPQEDLSTMTARDIELVLEQIATQDHRSAFDIESFHRFRVLPVDSLAEIDGYRLRVGLLPAFCQKSFHVVHVVIIALERPVIAVHCPRPLE